MSENGKKDFHGLTVVVPTLNEAEAIGKVIEEILSVGIPKESILIVDGGSSDGTAEVAKSLGVSVVMQEGRGKALAIKTASRLVKSEFALIMDGDYTYPAKHIVDLYDKAREGYSLVIGWRKYGKGSQSPIYKLGNWLLTKTFNILFGTRLHDVLSGMYLLRSEVLRELSYEMSGFSIESEIVAHVASTSGDVSELPIEYRKRIGKKKLGVFHGLSIYKSIVSLAWRYNPTFFIFIAGASLLVPGLLLGSWVAYRYFFLGINHFLRGMVAIVLVLVGIQSLLLAVLSLYVKRMEYRILRLLKKMCRERP